MLRCGKQGNERDGEAEKGGVMSRRTYDVVQALAGQKNSIVIPRPYLAFFAGDQQAYQLAAILNQLVFWSGCTTRDDGWFYKTHDELGEEVSLSADQVRRVIDKLTKVYFPGVIETTNKRVNGDKVKHYRLDGDRLVELIFPVEEKEPGSPNGNGEPAEPETRSRQTGTAETPFPSGEVAVPILYTDQYTDPDLQIINPSSLQNSGECRNEGIDDFSIRHPEAAVYSPSGKRWGTTEDLSAAEWIFKKNSGR
ncbi:hypothetical protein [Photorhabdus temperata]|uniref:hypothetical protein n=1 Tax=Photorhabdus temperata TaxID=574560 RepID=UPI00038A0223|nr:hypothetical protein [Photorhabdus temperata]EQB98775.1 phage O protein family [Photorhabdus temperata subsp. temperata M1021]